MLRRLLLLLVPAFGALACERPDPEPWPPTMPPAPTTQYTFQDPRTTVWRVFEGEGQGDFRPCVRAVPGGLIEWTSGSVVGEGRGLAKGNMPQDGLMARRAARLVAARNALLAAGGIDVGAGGTFRNVPAGTVRLDAVLRDFQEIRSDFDPATRTATSAVRIPLYGARGVVRIAGLNLRAVARTWDWPAAPPAEAGEAKMILLDLRRTIYAPALLPRILAPDGRCIFDAAELGEDELAWRPAAVHVVYAPATSRPPREGVLPPEPIAGAAPIFSEQTPGAFEAFEESVGQTFSSRPLVLTRCRAGSQPGTIVLSEKAALRLHTHLQTRELLRAGKVVIVLSAPAAAPPPTPDPARVP